MDKDNDHPLHMHADSWVRAVFFVENLAPCACHERPFNWLAQVYRAHVTDAKFRCVYRFRYYYDEKVFDSGDKRSWTVFEVESDDIEPAVEALRKVMDMIIATHPRSTHKTLHISGGMEDWQKAMEESGFAHSKSTAKAKA